MGFFFQKPSFLLSKYIKQYWALDYTYPEGQNYIHRIIPNGIPELMLFIGGQAESLDSTKPLEDSFVFSGLKKEFYDIELTGHVRLFSVSFKPHVIPLFFSVPASETYQENISLRYIVKNSLAKLEDNLQKTESFNQQVAEVESFLTHLLKSPSFDYRFQRMNEIILSLSAGHSEFNIDQLAKNSFLSRKQFEREFKHWVGSSPKQFLKILRFQKAIFRKELNETLPIGEIALESGYYDSAHMVRDFQQLSGYNPKRFFKKSGYYSDYFH